MKAAVFGLYRLFILRLAFGVGRAGGSSQSRKLWPTFISPPLKSQHRFSSLTKKSVK